MLPEAFVSKSDWFVEALQRSTNNPDTIKKSAMQAGSERNGNGASSQKSYLEIVDI